MILKEKMKEGAVTVVVREIDGGGECVHIIINGQQLHIHGSNAIILMQMLNRSAVMMRAEWDAA